MAGEAAIKRLFMFSTAARNLPHSGYAFYHF